MLLRMGFDVRILQAPHQFFLMREVRAHVLEKSHGRDDLSLMRGRGQKIGGTFEQLPVLFVNGLVADPVTVLPFESRRELADFGLHPVQRADIVFKHLAF